jgi:hypothetical protein
MQVASPLHMQKAATPMTSESRRSERKADYAGGGLAASADAISRTKCHDNVVTNGN